MLGHGQGFQQAQGGEGQRAFREVGQMSDRQLGPSECGQLVRNGSDHLDTLLVQAHNRHDERGNNDGDEKLG